MSSPNRDRSDNVSTALSNITATSAIVSVAMLAKRHPIVSSTWLLGLMICFFFAGLTPSPEAMTRYHDTMNTVDRPAIYDLSRKVNEASRAYTNSKTMFFFCNEQCQPNKKIYDELNEKLRILNSQENEKIRNANNEVGIFSTIGVADTRERFFENFNAGKQAATTQSKWNLFFTTFRAIGRDEKLIEYIMTIVLQVLMNFTFGVLIAGISFICGLYSLISQYKAGILSGLIFYLLAAVASIAFIATWILLLWCCVGTTVAVGVSQLNKMVDNQNRRIGASGDRYGQQGIRNGGSARYGDNSYAPPHGGPRYDRDA
jgi:hypothetical protein